MLAITSEEFEINRKRNRRSDWHLPVGPDRAIFSNETRAFRILWTQRVTGRRDTRNRQAMDFLAALAMAGI